MSFPGMKTLSKEEMNKMTFLEHIVQQKDAGYVSMQIDALQPEDINVLIPQEDGSSMYLSKSLLMGPIMNCDFEMIAVLLLHGANPFAPMKTFISGRSGDKEIETRSALEQCVIHAHDIPSSFVFLLRLMDLRRPDVPLDQKPCFNIRPGYLEVVVQPNSWNYLGRYVNAPLTATNFDDDEYRASRTALMYACEYNLPWCVKWLLEARKADPALHDVLGIAVSNLEKEAGPRKEKCLHIVQLLLSNEKVKAMYLSRYAARLEPWHHLLLF